MNSINIREACPGLKARYEAELPVGSYLLTIHEKKASVSMICPAGGKRVFATRLHDGAIELDCIAGCTFVRNPFSINNRPALTSEAH